MTSTKRERRDGEWEEHSAAQPKKLREDAVTSMPPDTDCRTDDVSQSAEGSSLLLRRAQYWYYQDTSQQLQGPFCPANMREWLTAGYFDGSQMVAPSYRGEVPQHFDAIATLFEPLSTAFVSDVAIDNRPPPEELASEPDNDTTPTEAAPLAATTDVLRTIDGRIVKPSACDSVLYKRDYNDFTHNVHVKR